MQPCSKSPWHRDYIVPAPSIIDTRLVCGTFKEFATESTFSCLLLSLSQHMTGVVIQSTMIWYYVWRRWFHYFITHIYIKPFSLHLQLNASCLFIAEMTELITSAEERATGFILNRRHAPVESAWQTHWYAFRRSIREADYRHLSSRAHEYR